MERPPGRVWAKSTAHRWFKKWVQAGVFEAIRREAGSCVEQQGKYRLYECFIDASFSKAKGGGGGIGCTKVGKGVKIMVLVDARGLPVAVDTAPANRAENRLVQQLFDFMLPSQVPERVIGDKAYDSDALDGELAKEGIELISPHRRNRRPENKTQDGRPLRRYKRRWTVERTIAWLQNFRRLCISLGTHSSALPRSAPLYMRNNVTEDGFGIASRVFSSARLAGFALLFERRVTRRLHEQGRAPR
jgi:transposase